MAHTENGRPGSHDAPGLLEDLMGATDPFDHPTARAFSCYSGVLGPKGRTHGHMERLYRIPAGRLLPDEHDERVSPEAQVAHDQLRALILGEYYPCLGARAAFNYGSYRVGFYKDLAHEAAVLANGRDLRRFVAEYQELGAFATFVAIFKRPRSTSEAQFEAKLWKHLQALHDHDRSGWDPHYEPDPKSPHFAFSFAGCAFFVVGMHPGSSRLSRRLGYVAVMFNPESQIHRLKREGLFDGFAHQVRRRDVLLQGTVNPSIPVQAHSLENEARAYSGMAHPEGSEWKCPFAPRPDVVAAHEFIPPDTTPCHKHKAEHSCHGEPPSEPDGQSQDPLPGSAPEIDGT